MTSRSSDCPTCGQLYIKYSGKRGRPPKQCSTCLKGQGKRMWSKPARAKTKKSPVSADAPELEQLGDRPGLLIWEGPSRFNGEPIKVFARYLGHNPTGNDKLGDMSTIVIVPGDILPREAIATGRDESVCGACLFRPFNKGGCYVRMLPGPESTAWAHRHNPYPLMVDPSVFKLKGVRIGDWGDPAAVPVEVWRPILDNAPLVVSYTHAWKTHKLDPAEWGWCMASTNTPAEHDEAVALGWRSFRIAPKGDRKSVV